MTTVQVPNTVPNWICGEQVLARAGETFPKVSPHDGRTLASVARSRDEDVQQAVDAAKRAFREWADVPAVQRGDILFRIAHVLADHRNEIARIVAVETGKSMANALGETDGAIALARFMAGEGQRLYGRTTTSGSPNRQVMTVRQPLGVAGLIIAANTPIANVAWKVFPALICGNAAILKAAEDTPLTAWLFAYLAHEAGLPKGVLNVVNGFGTEAGAPLVAHRDVAVISFTGSTTVGKEVAVTAGRRLARVSLELGGKNPFVVCDDADLEHAVKWALLSAFSNAGQRCAASSRMIVFDTVYDRFRDLLVKRASTLKVGPGDDDDFGPVINARQLDCMLSAVRAAVARGARVLCGGSRLLDPAHANGFYIAPTLIEGVAAADNLSRTELFGPISALYRVNDFEEAVALANDSPYGLTACIHTSSVHRALEFVRRIESGVAVVNAGTFGSEPHMPFGGVKQSGNGSREPGTEALDIYSNLKNVYLNILPELV